MATLNRIVRWKYTLVLCPSGAGLLPFLPSFNFHDFKYSRLESVEGQAGYHARTCSAGAAKVGARPWIWWLHRVHGPPVDFWRFFSPPNFVENLRLRIRILLPSPQQHPFTTSINQKNQSWPRNYTTVPSVSIWVCALLRLQVELHHADLH